MAVQNNDYAYFYNSENGDRVYDADSMTDWLLPFFTSGVFNGNLQVTANDDMSVTIDVGYCNIKGKTRHFKAETKLDLEVASGTLNRIDNVILRRDDTRRNIYLMIVTGGNAASPTAPDLVRNNSVYDLKLAEINIKAGTIKVTQADIKDCRMDATVCGWVVSTVDEIDFSQITEQFETYIKEFKNGNEKSFEHWFDEVKNQLTTDAAGKLQNEIDELKYPALNAVVNGLPVWKGPSVTRNGVLFEPLLNGGIHVVGTATENANLAITDKVLVDMMVNDMCTMSFNLTPKNDTYDMYANVYSEDGSTVIGQYGLLLDKDRVTMKSFEGKKYRVTFGFNVYKGKTIDLILYPMLEKGKMAHPYVPYTGFDSLYQAGKGVLDWTQLHYDNLKTDALLVDTANKNGDANKPAYIVAGETKINLPSDCGSASWRTAWINPTCIYVIAEGVDTSNRPTTWKNRYTGNSWTGWYREVNSGNINEQSVLHASTADKATNAIHASTADAATHASTAGIADTATNAIIASNAKRAITAANVDTVSGFSRIRNVARNTDVNYVLGFNGGSEEIQCVTTGTLRVHEAEKADSASRANLADFGRAFNGSYGTIAVGLNNHRFGFSWDDVANVINVYVDSTLVGQMAFK